MRIPFGKSTITTAITLILSLGGLPLSSLASAAGDATIELEICKAGIVVGTSGGGGKLTSQGKEYPASIGGASLGATIGASKTLST